METFSSLLPATVVAAIVLFILKEVLEAIRRLRADSRKGRAIRTLLARECELNLWTHTRLRRIIGGLKEDLAAGIPAEYSVVRKGPDKDDFRFTRVGPDGMSSGMLPDAHMNVMDKVMLDVAALDRKLFGRLETAYDAVINMKHVRDSLINFVESEDEDDKLHLENFPEYALDELTDSLTELGALYRACTGKELKQARIR